MITLRLLARARTDILRLLTAALLLALALSTGTTPARAAASQTAASAPVQQASVQQASVKAGIGTMVGQLSGEPTSGIPQLNSTGASADFYAGDLGTMWSNPSGVTRVAYGDSYAQPFTAPQGGGVGGNPGHICNALFTSDTPVSNLSSAMTLTDPNGTNQPDVIDGCDSTGASKIPTAGVFVNGADYVKIVEITDMQTGANNGSYVVKSTDGGVTWTRVPGLGWASTGPDANFQQTSYADQDGYVYMFTIIVGRGGPMYVARVPDAQFENKAAYQYWNGNDWITGDDSGAAPIITADVGEPSVQFDPALHLWLTTYLDVSRGAIVLRYAPSPVGPWSGEQIVYRQSDSSPGTSGIYGGFMHPGANATDLYLDVSEWYPYQVYLVHVPLTPGAGPLNLVSDGDFSDPMAGSPTNQGDPGAFGWSVLGYGKVDVGQGNGYQSPNEGYLYTASTGFTDLYQTVAVQPYHDYTFSAWVRTSASVTAAYIGVRNMPQTTHWEVGPTGPLTGYTQETVSFNSGPNAQVQVYAGMWPASGTTSWLQLGQVQLTQSALVGDGGFESQTSNTLSAPWHPESLKSTWTGWTGVDLNQGWAHSGANNGYIRTDTGDWNAIKQLVPVQPNTDYTLTAWVRTSGTFGNGFIGVRPDVSSQVLQQTWFGSTNQAWTQETVTLNSGGNDFLTLYGGYWAPGSDSWVQFDDISLVPAG